MPELPLNVFAGLGLQLDRVAERREDAGWLAQLAQRDDARFLAIDTHGQTWVRRDDDVLRWLDATERERWLEGLPTSFMGLVGEQPHFLLVLGETADPAALDARLDARRIGLREVGLQLPALDAALYAYAKGLAHWQRETRHCAFCGTALTLVSAGHRAQCGNPRCGRLHFPRTDAAIIVIVEHEGACLLGRQAGWPTGRYSTLAGFVEPGESLEDAVRREVAEESGVIVDQVRYHSSQPWPMPASLMVGFTATTRVATIHRRDQELEDARWFTPAQIVAGLRDGSFVPPPRLSVSYQLITHWLASQGVDLDALTGAP